jgi:hypothetical protein
MPSRRTADGLTSLYWSNACVCACTCMRVCVCVLNICKTKKNNPHFKVSWQKLNCKIVLDTSIHNYIVPELPRNQRHKWLSKNQTPPRLHGHQDHVWQSPLGRATPSGVHHWSLAVSLQQWIWGQWSWFPYKSLWFSDVLWPTLVHFQDKSACMQIFTYTCGIR